MRYRSLDGFRGICALMVVIYHLNVSGVISNSNIVNNSYLFVEFFFVLSGFVITSSYNNKVHDYKEFILFVKRRLARIWPLHIFMTLAFIPFALVNLILGIDLGERFSFSSFLQNLILIQALGINNETTWNIPSWSISVEFYTYVLFALVCWFVTLRNIAWVSLVISIASVAILYLYSTMGDTHSLAILRCFYSFFLGVVAYHIHDRIKIRSFLEIFILFLILTLFISFDIQSTDTLAYLMPVLFFGTVVIFSRDSGIISRLLMMSVFRNLGILSFSIYLTHAWFVTFIKAISKVSEIMFGYSFMYTVDGQRTIDFGIGIFNDAIYIPYIIAVVLISRLTFKYIEKPCQNWINNSTPYTFQSKANV